MKKLIILCFALSMFSFLVSYSQETEQNVVKSTKKDQSKLYNDVNISYGIGTIYLFTSEVNHNYYSYDSYNSKQTDINSPGTLMIGYNRMLNKIIMIGFVASYIKCSYKRTYTDYNGTHEGEATFNDNLLSGMAKLTFNYVNKPVVRVYSSAGLGITVDLSKVQGELPQNIEETDRKLLFCGQLTFMGVRFGRSFGGFCEFGFGTNGIITAGLNYQFGD
jgi:hypothetical protein